MGTDNAFLACRSAWKSVIELGIKSKRGFQQDADECMRFFNGTGELKDALSSSEFLYLGKRSITRPSIEMRVNKVAEGVQLFGPTLYYKNPICKVNPRKPPDIPMQVFGDPHDPNVQQMMQPVLGQLQQQQQIDALRSALLSGYLNYLPTAIDLKNHSRDGVDESIIKGRGVLWAVMDTPAGGRKMPKLEYDTVDNLQVDPDAERIHDCKWVARRFIKPTWEVEQMRGLPHGTLKGNYESHSQYAAVEAAGDQYKRKQGKTNDLIVYWGIWSKMGIGGLLKGISPDAADIDRYGQYVYVEICESYNYFLNAPKEIWDNEEEVRRRVQWETPFWCDVPTSNGWPFAQLDFHRVPRQAWPMSHFKPAMGELKFINWAYSFLISGMQKRSRDFIAVPASLDEETMNSILEGDDLTLLKISQNLGVPINQLISFIEHPGFPEWQFKVIQAVEINFEKRTGLSELMYGMQQTQDRSATETKTKENFVNVRPDDMASCVEDWMTDGFRKLALMARWHMSGQDIAQIFGPVIGQLWQQHVATAEIEEVIHQLEYRIEAGSAKKPNQRKDQEDANQLMQSLFPMLSQFAQSTGNVDQVNALLSYWGKALNIPVDGMLLPPPAPPSPPQPEPPKISLALKGEDVQLLGLDEAIRSDFGLQGPAPDGLNPTAQGMYQKEAQHGQDMRHADEKHKLNQKLAKEKAKAQTNGKK